MTRSADLQLWLKTIIPLLQATYSSLAEVAEPGTPAALVQYVGDGDGTNLDSAARTETYHVTLLCENAGANETERQVGVAQLERPLVRESSTLARVNPRWDHLTTSFLDADRGNGRATYAVTLHVTGD